MTSRLAFVLTSLALIAGQAVWAQRVWGQNVPEPWRSKLVAIEQDLQAESWEQAEAGAGRLVDEMVAQFGPGPTSSAVVAFALSLQARAAVGLEQFDDALWHWQLAQNLNPALRTAPVPASLGATGEWLASHRLRTAGSLTGGRAELEVEVGPLPIDAHCPQVPSDDNTKSSNQAYGELEVEVLIDVDGQVRDPVVMQGDSHPADVVWGLSHLRQWSFRPARVGERPVATLQRISGCKRGTLVYDMARSEQIAMGYRAFIEGDLPEAEAHAERRLAAELDCFAGDEPQRCNPSATMLLRALIAAETGQRDEALWNWQLLFSFAQTIAYSDLTGLDERITSILQKEAAPCPMREDCQIPKLAERPDLRPPRPVFTPALELPADLGPAVGADLLIAEIVVDREGRVREPVMRAGRFQMNGYLALQHLRDWRFEPALEGGEPVAVIHEVSIPLATRVDPQRLGEWRQGLSRLEASLRSGDWQAAHDGARNQLLEMSGQIRQGGSDLLARTLTLLALSEVGLGRRDDALWHWQAAQNLLIQLRYLDLSPYGMAGVWLDRHRLRHPWAGQGELKILPLSDHAPMTRRRSGSEPSKPEGTPGWAKIQVLVDADGIPHAPVVLDGGDPRYLIAAVEAMRKWRFEPFDDDGSGAAIPFEVSLPLAEASELEPGDEEGATKLVRLADKASDPALAKCYRQAARSLYLPRPKLRPAGDSKGPRSLQSRWIYGKKRGMSRDQPKLIGGEVQKPVKILASAPQYTKKARRKRIQGAIIVATIIDRDGRIRQPKVLKGLPGGLNAQALEALCGWRFEPATLGAEPVDVYYNLTVNFRLQSTR